MTEEEFTEKFDRYELDDAYYEYVWEHGDAQFDEHCLQMMENGDYFESFKESMVTK